MDPKAPFCAAFFCQSCSGQTSLEPSYPDSAIPLRNLFGAKKLKLASFLSLEEGIGRKWFRLRSRGLIVKFRILLSSLLLLKIGLNTILVKVNRVITYQLDDKG